ncbi:MAG: hypothetical protein EBZ78_08760 [Verrucomicrobia bacterium]|nr:hypothetical protein [Verrucomicrobiota bacterium]
MPLFLLFLRQCLFRRSFQFQLLPFPPTLPRFWGEPKAQVSRATQAAHPSDQAQKQHRGSPERRLKGKHGFPGAGGGAKSRQCQRDST